MEGVILKNAGNAPARTRGQRSTGRMEVNASPLNRSPSTLTAPLEAAPGDTGGGPMRATLDHVAVAVRDLEEALAFLRALEPLRANPNLRVVVGSLADWNLRLLKRLDPALAIGLDPAYYLDAPVGTWSRLPVRVSSASCPPPV